MTKIVKITVLFCLFALLLSCGEEEEPGFRKFAYITNDGFLGGIEKVDVTDPKTSYNIIYRPSTPQWGIYVEEDYIYTINVWSLIVRDRKSLEEVSSCRLVKQSYNMSVLNNYAYLAAGDDGFGIIDISNPKEPYTIGFYEEPEALDIFALNNYIYVVGRFSFAVMDISQPDFPKKMGSCELDSGRGVYVSGGYAYVTTNNWKGDTFHVIDVSDPSNPHEVASYDPPGDYTGADQVFAEGGYAYVTMNGPKGLWIIDISNPLSPQGVWSCDITQVAGIKILDGYAYIGGNGLRIIDIIDPTNPQIVRRYGSNRVLGFQVVIQ